MERAGFCRRRPARPARTHRHINPVPVLVVTRALFVWKYLGADLPMAFTADFVGVGQDPVTCTVRPEIGWAVCERRMPDR